MIIPKFKCVRAIEGDDARKSVLLKQEVDKETIEKYAESHGFDVTSEQVTLGYENMNMSKGMCGS